MTLFIVGWLVLSVIIGGAADQRGRNGFVWVFISLLISPLLAALLLLLFPVDPLARTASDDKVLWRAIQRERRRNRL